MGLPGVTWDELRHILTKTKASKVVLRDKSQAMGLIPVTNDPITKGLLSGSCRGPIEVESHDGLGLEAYGKKGNEKHFL